MQELNLIGVLSTGERFPVIEPKNITANGTYTAPEGVDGYSPVTVNVPVSQPVIKPKTITANGTYTAPEGVDGYSPVTVNVPVSQPVIKPKTITANGTYTAPEGVDGYSPVTVNVLLPQNAYLLKSVNTPTPIASFSDGEEMVMPSLKVSIEPQQEGSGDPSPENKRPISGWDEVDVNVSGVNVWDEEWEVGSIADSNGQDATNSNYRRSVGYIKVEPNTKYYFKVPTKYGTTYRFYEYKINKDYIGIKGVNIDGTFTTDSNTSYIRFRIATTEDYTNDISINYPSTDTEYHAYNGATYTIDLDGTRYGGALDVVSGVLTVDKGYIASYNGEILPSTWISDRNVYVEGTSPTTGAQVVYELATPLTIQLTPTAVKSLLGQNNVWADTGDITDAEYFSKEV